MHAANSPQPLLLIDGPIWPGIPANQEREVCEMARDLVKYDAFRNRADAERCLNATGKYRPFNVFAFASKAMQWATEEIVAQGMSDV